MCDSDERWATLVTDLLISVVDMNCWCGANDPDLLQSFCVVNRHWHHVLSGPNFWSRVEGTHVRWRNWKAHTRFSDALLQCPNMTFKSCYRCIGGLFLGSATRSLHDCQCADYTKTTYCLANRLKMRRLTLPSYFISAPLWSSMCQHLLSLTELCVQWHGLRERLTFQTKDICLPSLSRFTSRVANDRSLDETQSHLHFVVAIVAAAPALSCMDADVWVYSVHQARVFFGALWGAKELQELTIRYAVHYKFEYDDTCLCLPTDFSLTSLKMRDYEREVEKMAALFLHHCLPRLSSLDLCQAAELAFWLASTPAAQRAHDWVAVDDTERYPLIHTLSIYIGSGTYSARHDYAPLLNRFPRLTTFVCYIDACDDLRMLEQLHWNYSALRRFELTFLCSDEGWGLSRSDVAAGRTWANVMDSVIKTIRRFDGLSHLAFRLQDFRRYTDITKKEHYMNMDHYTREILTSHGSTLTSFVLEAELTEEHRRALTCLCKSTMTPQYERIEIT